MRGAHDTAPAGLPSRWQPVLWGAATGSLLGAALVAALALGWASPARAQTPDRWPLTGGGAAYQPPGDKVGQIAAKDRSITRLYLARSADGQRLTLTEVEHDAAGALDAITVHTVVRDQLAPMGAAGSSVEADEPNDYFGRQVSVAILLCRGVNQPCIQRERIGPVNGQSERLSPQTFFKAHFDQADAARAFLTPLLGTR